MKLINMSSLLFLGTSLSANATSQPQECASLNQIRIEMEVAAANIVNVKTTRTPEGGPYLPKRFICKSGTCEVQSEAKVKKIYEPEHPDADADGNVAYPDINLGEQNTQVGRLIRDYEDAAAICFNKS